MPPCAAFAALLLAALGAAAPAADYSQSRVCRLIAGDPSPTFERHGLSGTTSCTCVSETEAACQPLRPYPTVAPGSPGAQLAEFHRPQLSSPALQALLAYQIQHQCYVLRLGGRRCEVTWPADGSAAPLCDCAARDGPVRIRLPFFVDSIESRELLAPSTA